MASECLPWWHNIFAELPNAGIGRPNCQASTTEKLNAKALNCQQLCMVSSSKTAFVGQGNDGVFGWITCSPEDMRRHCQAVLEQLGVWRGHLSLDVYSLARNIAAEVGSQSVETKMALALSTIGAAKARGLSVTQLILAGTGRYGRIHGFLDTAGVGDCLEVCTRPGRRFTASSRDPSIQDILIADFALRGRAGNFANGADDQASITIFNADRIRDFASRRTYWVGPIPGVNHRQMFLMGRRDDIAPSSREGQELIARGIRALSTPAPAMPQCLEDVPSPTLKTIGTALSVSVLGGLAGLLIAKASGAEIHPILASRLGPLVTRL